MKRFLLLIVGFLTLAATALHAQPASQPDTTVRYTIHPQPATQPALRYRLLPAMSELKAGNAAPLYYTAAIMLRERSPSRDQAEDWLELPPEKLPLDEAKSALDRDLRSPLELVDLASRREECRWDYPIREQGLYTLLPELSNLRSIGYWLRLRTRVEIREHRYDDAIRSIQTALAMSRHVARGHTLVNVLTGAAIARQGLDSARELSAAPDAPNLYWALADLPRPMFSIREAYEFERAAHFDTLRLDELRADNPLSPQQLANHVESMSRWLMGETYPNRAALALRAAGDLPRAKKFLLADGVTQQQLAALPDLQIALLYYARSVQVAMDDTVKYAGLPFHLGYQRAIADKGIESLDDNPFRSLLPVNIVQPWRTLAAVDRQILAMQIAESVRDHAARNSGKLPESLADLKNLPAVDDPFTGKPFVYEAKGDWFAISGPAAAESDSPLRYEITLSR